MHGLKCYPSHFAWVGIMKLVLYWHMAKLHAHVYQLLPNARHWAQHGMEWAVLVIGQQNTYTWLLKHVWCGHAEAGQN